MEIQIIVLFLTEEKQEKKIDFLLWNDKHNEAYAIYPGTRNSRSEIISFLLSLPSASLRSAAAEICC